SNDARPPNIESCICLGRCFHPCWLSNFTPSAPLTDTGLKAPKLPTHSSHLDTTRIQYDRLSGRTDDDCRTKHTKPGTADWSLTLHAILSLPPKGIHQENQGRGEVGRRRHPVIY
ncbi:hypothetical protein GQ607_013777, partial [Colletotrichum asianum]